MGDMAGGQRSSRPRAQTEGVNLELEAVRGLGDGGSRVDQKGPWVSRLEARGALA